MENELSLRRDTQGRAKALFAGVLNRAPHRKRPAVRRAFWRYMPS